MNNLFTIADKRPIKDNMTISRPAHLGESTPVTWFSMGAGTSITSESYDTVTVYICEEGAGEFLLGESGAPEIFSKGDILVVPPRMLAGCRTETGVIYTEIIIRKEDCTMNAILKAGNSVALKDLISYEEGSIANLDIVHADNMKFVLMAFDEGTGLTPHRAPGNAILTALEGEAIIGYEGVDVPIKAGESFRFDKNGLHSVTPQGRFKMSLLLVIE